ncbi:hypothetical protein GVN21_14735 [Caulobacter sp. SLTY]|uniref:hypothetical protein n=1 Tax=Caulobacter sp. SLTY TaxID=2683262 RepID=UPI001412E0AC|nr:hypothetical protein [Caulobacter sp. SLTY]NBB16617.1 hypothetical protein [Caulobacter sp. SLTY]
MSASVNELHVMDVWVFRLPETAQARALYEGLPAALKVGAELRCGITGAELRTPSNEAADWLRGHLAAA